MAVKHRSRRQRQLQASQLRLIPTPAPQQQQAATPLQRGDQGRALTPGIHKLGAGGGGLHPLRGMEATQLLLHTIVGMQLGQGFLAEIAALVEAEPIAQTKLERIERLAQFSVSSGDALAQTQPIVQL